MLNGGACVAMDVNTGEILAMASNPHPSICIIAKSIKNFTNKWYA